MPRIFAILLVTLAMWGCNAESPEDSGTRASALASVTGSGVRAHMEVLAADDMEGREAGTSGYGRAADYVAEQYRNAGLDPLGDGGSYLQSIDFFETRLIPESPRLFIRKADSRIDLKFRDDFVTGGSFGKVDVGITAPLVFVGYGIQAPEYDHDDFAGVDVRGKILVVLSGAPPLFDTDQRAFYSSGTGKRESAVDRGAVGMITVRTPVDQKRRAWDRYLPGIGKPGMRWLDSDGTRYHAFPELVGIVTISNAGALKLFEFSGHDLDRIFEKHAAGETGSFEMGVSATIASTSKQRVVSSANVVGVLRGSDPALRDEYVVYTAHLDHIGIRPGDDEDEIHNGAYDNAAGVGVILEIARSMAAMKPAPRRSIIFAAVTGEEKGLQGSSYFARNSPVPVDQLVANINIDMPYFGFEFSDIQAFGAEHSNLLAAVTEATAELDMTLTPDPMPEEVRFVRSDQFSFVKEGVPAVAFKAGATASDPDLDGGAILGDFLKNHYHRASDDLDLAFSPEAAQKFTRAALLLGLIVADQDEKPRWNEGDFFGDRFAK
jgi:hypothetical protein